MHSFNPKFSILEGKILAKEGTPSIDSNTIGFFNGTKAIDYAGLGSIAANGVSYVPYFKLIYTGSEMVLKKIGLNVNELSQPLINWVSIQQDISLKHSKEYLLNNNKLWQDNLNLYLVSEFMGEFALKYHIDNEQEVFAFFKENKLITSLISRAITQIEVYFRSVLSNLELSVQEDPEDEIEYKTLYLFIKCSGDLIQANKILLKFQNEWLIPLFGSKINLFNVDIV